MAKFYGKIGFASLVEVEPDVWEDSIIDRDYSGDLVRNLKRTQPSGGINDNVNVSNEISIIADPYANENFHSIRYVEFMGTKWKISEVEVQYPRLLLTMGGVYNGKQTRSAE